MYEKSADSSLFPFRISFVPPSRFYGRRWHRYTIPTRITLGGRSYSVYRWLCWNFTLGSRV